MEKCKTKFVPKFATNSEKCRIKSATKAMKKNDAELKKAKTDEEKEKLLTRRRFLKADSRPFNKTEKKQQNKIFEKMFCNPGCKETIFEEDFDSEKYVRQTCKKNCKGLQTFYKNFRKTLMKGKKTMLDKDSFYDAYNKKRKEKLKKEGALSGCTAILF